MRHSYGICSTQTQTENIIRVIVLREVNQEAEAEGCCIRYCSMQTNIDS